MEKFENVIFDRFEKFSDYIDNVGGNGIFLFDVFEWVFMDYWVYGNVFVELCKVKILGKNYLIVYYIFVVYVWFKKVSVSN